MICPNCGAKLKLTDFNNIIFNHCPNCGGSFFGDNQINRISLKQARKLNKSKSSDIISSEEKICPIDGIPMSRLTNKSIPHHVTLLGCNKCKSVFAYPNDLVEFKKAQQVKINYFKSWRLPLPSLKSVLVYASFIIVSLSFISSV